MRRRRRLIGNADRSAINERQLRRRPPISKANNNRECILYLTLPLILSVNKANESALTAQNLAWAGLADTCRHLLNSADLLSLLTTIIHLLAV